MRLRSARRSSVKKWLRSSFSCPNARKRRSRLSKMPMSPVLWLRDDKTPRERTPFLQGLLGRSRDVFNECRQSKSRRELSVCWGGSPTPSWTEHWAGALCWQWDIPFFISFFPSGLPPRPRTLAQTDNCRAWQTSLCPRPPSVSSSPMNGASPGPMGSCCAC